MDYMKFYDYISKFGLEYWPVCNEDWIGDYEVEEDSEEDDIWCVYIPLDMLYEVPSVGDYFTFGPFGGYCDFVDFEMREVGMQVHTY